MNIAPAPRHHGCNTKPAYICSIPIVFATAWGLSIWVEQADNKSGVATVVTIIHGFCTAIATEKSDIIFRALTSGVVALGSYLLLKDQPFLCATAAAVDFLVCAHFTPDNFDKKCAALRKACRGGIIYPDTPRVASVTIGGPDFAAAIGSPREAATVRQMQTIGSPPDHETPQVEQKNAVQHIYIAPEQPIENVNSPSSTHSSLNISHSESSFSNLGAPEVAS